MEKNWKKGSVHWNITARLHFSLQCSRPQVISRDKINSFQSIIHRYGWVHSLLSIYSLMKTIWIWWWYFRRVDRKRNYPESENLSFLLESFMGKLPLSSTSVLDLLPSFEFLFHIKKCVVTAKVWKGIKKNFCDCAFHCFHPAPRKMCELSPVVGWWWRHIFSKTEKTRLKSDSTWRFTTPDRSPHHITYMTPPTDDIFSTYYSNSIFISSSSLTNRTILPEWAWVKIADEKIPEVGDVAACSSFQDSRLSSAQCFSRVHSIKTEKSCCFIFASAA